MNEQRLESFCWSGSAFMIESGRCTQPQQNRSGATGHTHRHAQYPTPLSMRMVPEFRSRTGGGYHRKKPLPGAEWIETGMDRRIRALDRSQYITYIHTIGAVISFEWEQCICAMFAHSSDRLPSLLPLDVTSSRTPGGRSKKVLLIP